MAELHSDIGIVGLTPFARAVALALAAAGVRVALLDDTGELPTFMAAHFDTRGGMVGYTDVRDFVDALDTPRTIVVSDDASRQRLSTNIGAQDRVIVAAVAAPAVLTQAVDALARELVALVKPQSGSTN